VDIPVILLLIVFCVTAWAVIMKNWRAAIYLLVCLTPFTGIIVVTLESSALGNLARDIVAIIPLYISFLFTKRASDRAVMPLPVIISALALALVIAGQVAAQNTDNPAVGLVGAKIWLLYIPLIIIGSAFLNSREDLQSLLRTIVTISWVPLTVGVLMWAGAIAYDYQKSVEFLYGEYARSATQGFVAMKVGTSTLYRIPSTFQFVSQYAAYCEFSIFPIVMLIRSDVSRRWRIFGYVSLLLAILAALTAGSRGAFIFLPFIFIVLAVLRIGVRGTPSLATALVVIAGLGAGGLYFDQSALFDHVAELSESYGEGIVIGGLGYAMETAGLWGFGVGTGTIAARYVIDASQLNVFFSGTIENYYAKAWMELGALGFAAVLALLGSITLAGLAQLPRIRDPKLRDCGVAIVAMIVFVAFISTRGWALDQDPFAYYYYLFAGFLFKLPYLAAQPATRMAQRQSVRPTIGPPRRGAPVPGLRMRR
jgi:hypothetical protein